MKIVNTHETTSLFENVSPGELFTHGNRRGLRLDDSYELTPEFGTDDDTENADPDSYIVNAVDMESGEPFYVERDAMVIHHPHAAVSVSGYRVHGGTDANAQRPY